MSEERDLNIVKKYCQEILEILEVKSEVEVKNEDGVFKVSLKSEQPGVLIGYHGKTLNAFQLILSLIIYQQTGRWLKVIVDVDGYRQKREEVLKRMAASAAKRVKFSGQEQELPPMIPSERRIVHLYLSQDPEVETESRGEGKERRVVIKPKK